MNRTQETIYAAIGLIVLPPVIGSFAFLKDEKEISVVSCDTYQGRRGDTERIITSDGETLQLWPQFLGGPNHERAMTALCSAQQAKVTIRGARFESLPFWQRVIFGVEGT